MGKPGAGKSTLMKYALKEAPRKEDTVVVSFFFSARGSAIQKTSMGMFRSLLHQLLNQAPTMMSDFLSLYRKKHDTEQKEAHEIEWHVGELQEYLQQCIHGCSDSLQIRIYVDALDEIGEKSAIDLIEYFQQLAAGCSTLGICFSCRHFPILAPKDVLSICVEDENSQDIRQAVRSRLQSQVRDETKVKQLEWEISKRASGIFQWAVIVAEILNELCRKGNFNQRKIYKKIGELPVELHSLYEIILTNTSDNTRTVRLMEWLLFATESLTIGELRHAMVVGDASQYQSLGDIESSEDYPETYEEIKKQVNNLSGGLVEIYYNSWTRAKQLKFIHESVKDYLTQGGLRKLGQEVNQQTVQQICSVVRRYPMWGGVQALHGQLSQDTEALAHFRISRTCLKYSKLDKAASHLKHPKPEFKNLCQERNTLLEYASESTIWHCKKRKWYTSI